MAITKANRRNIVSPMDAKASDNRYFSEDLSLLLVKVFSISIDLGQPSMNKVLCISSSCSGYRDLLLVPPGVLEDPLQAFG